MMIRTKGFTLIELMVVVAIVAIISAVAYPSYDSYMKKSRRADAKVALSVIADRQERYYLQNSTYANNLAAINFPAVSDEGYYTLTIDAGDVNGFHATAQATGGQVNDTPCVYMTIDATGAKNGGAAANPVGDANKCW